METWKMSNDEEMEVDLLQVVYILWKNIVWILLIAVFCASAGFFAAAFLISPTYSASADMIVNNKQNEITQTGDVTVSDLSASATLVDTYSVILKSHTIIKKLADDLNLDYSYEKMYGMISVTTVNNTQVMRLTVRCGDSQTALRIVTKLADIAGDVIADKAEVGSVKTVDEPWTNGRIVAPNKKKYAKTGFLIGFGIMCAVSVLLELLDNTYKTESDLSNDLGLPILGVIPLEEGGVVSQEKRKSFDSILKKRMNKDDHIKEQIPF